MLSLNMFAIRRVSLYTSSDIDFYRVTFENSLGVFTLTLEDGEFTLTFMMFTVEEEALRTNEKLPFFPICL